MKRLFFLSAVALSLLFSAQTLSAQDPMEAPAEAVTYQTFYDALSPYGTWIDYPGYGHVWRPDVGADFRPYVTNGYWVNTDAGWYWDSMYDWGWAPFHYGDWMYDDAYGWLWEPGYDWATAWVEWGDIDGYYAWAPRGFNGREPHSFNWNVVNREHFIDHDLSGVLISNERVRREFPNIPAARTAPEVRDVERFTNSAIATRPMREVDNMAGMMNRRAEDHALPVYRPAVHPAGTPAQFRRATPETIRPVSGNSEWPRSNFEQQRQNIERMPMNNAGRTGGGNMGGGRMPAGGGRR